VIAFALNLVRILVVLLVVRFVLRFLAAVVQGYRGAERREVATEMVRDRVCDTFVPRARALMTIVDGREQYFCSPECRDRARRRLATT
jgi:hypothetical protein